MALHHRSLSPAPFTTEKRRRMYIGSRRVRSAGRASGSIEITLPPELTPLEGVPCNIIIRDGARPEIVLRPELSPSALIFARVWGRLRTLLALAGEIGEFPAADFDVSLLPPTSAPPLTSNWPDSLAS